jgi:Rho GDP-dissociation inhibitor
MSSHDDDMQPEETGYKVTQPKQSLAEYQQMGEWLPALSDA